MNAFTMARHGETKPNQTKPNQKQMKIVFNAMMPNREVSDMIGKAVMEYAEIGIFPSELEDLFTVEIKSIDGCDVAIVNPA